jgi:hypothetical protein
VVSRRSDASPTARVLILLRTLACHPEARASRRHYALTSRPARRSLANEQVGGPRTVEPVRLGGCCDPHYEARPCQLADLVFSHPGCPDGAIPDLGAGRRSEHVPRSPSGLDRVETVLRAHYRTTWPGTSDPAGRTIPRPDGSWPGSTRCGLSPIKPNELAARRCRQARPVGSRYHTQAWLSYGPLRPGLPANARCSHCTRLIEHADPGCELATTGG